MAKGGGWWQEKSLPGKSGIELANTSGLSTVSRPPVTIRLGEILKPEAERKPVKIRPPSPRTPPPREAVFGRSLSVEPTPKPIIRRRAQSLPSTREQRRRSTRMQVCLERVLCSELGITGTAQVLNLAFEKEVMVHYSFTNWRSKGDSKASWVSSVVRNRMAGEPDSDIFRFRLPVPPFILQPGALLEFAICFQVGGSEFWDNNNGQNYKLTCHSYKLTVPRECEDSMVHFI
ncbi:protein phosphatase 1, regulatory subunit 3Db isoform X2 [Anguilla rostrata]|uniref:protein phosphatase 1, regulatory subunit 3Db isoform X2 n=1 Tax=Anguilla rostrata TaxID=7938 RepID=UPI0030D4BA3A